MKPSTAVEVGWGKKDGEDVWTGFIQEVDDLFKRGKRKDRYWLEIGKFPTQMEARIAAEKAARERNLELVEFVYR